MLALPLLALAVSTVEAIGASAIFVLLSLLTNPAVASELLRVQLIASILRVDWL